MSPVPTRVGNSHVERSLESTIEVIYATATEDHDWSDLLGRVVDFVGAKSGMIGVSDVSTGFSDPNLTFVRLDEAIVEERWRCDYGFRDIWAEQGYAPKEAEVLTGAQLLSPDSLRQDLLYGHVLKPLGIEDCLVTSLSTHGSRVIFMSLYQDLFGGVFEREQKKRLRALAPHLVRAAKLETMLQESHVQKTVQRSALDNLEMAIFSVVRGKPKALNRRAEELLVEGELLSIRNGRLFTRDSVVNESLHAGIAAAGGTSIKVDPPTATPFSVRRKGDGNSSIGWIVPIGEKRETLSPILSLLEAPSGALIFLTDPAEAPRLAEDLVSKLFGLTLAEARIASSIASGERPAEYAERTGISIHTARWTIKQVQAKLGCRRQLDIASLLIRSVPQLRD